MLETTTLQMMEPPTISSMMLGEVRSTGPTPSMELIVERFPGLPEYQVIIALSSFVRSRKVHLASGVLAVKGVALPLASTPVISGEIEAGLMGART
ncbi:unannotated protein [freshwater metagenome]|uniref:Unannotated protein n=1 Tax=freshwater metagenome TaxID=449393 RepID=A0A6J7VFF0_9ZZZZ